MRFKGALALVVLAAAPALAADPPEGTKVYVANTDSDTVSVVDGVNGGAFVNDATGVIISNDIPVGREPRGIVISPDRRFVYVVNRFGSQFPPTKTGTPRAFQPGGTPSVTVIDTLSDEAIDEIAIAGGEPYNLAISPDGSRLYVVAKAASSLHVVDTATRTEIASLLLSGDPASPEGITILPSGSKVYAVNRQAGTVDVVSTATNALVGEPITVGAAPRDAAASASGARVIVVGEGGPRIIDTATDTVVATLPDVGTQRDVGTFGNLAYVTNFGHSGTDVPEGSTIAAGAGTIDVYDLAAGTYVKSYDIGTQTAYAIAVAPDGSRAWVTDQDRNEVVVVDLATGALIGEPSQVGFGPRGVALLWPEDEILVDSFLLPANVAVKIKGDGKDSLAASGVFDQGSGSLDGAAPATLKIGGFTKTFTLERKGISYFAPAEGGLKLKVTPSRVGSSRGKFRLSLTKATLAGLVATDGEVEFSFTSPSGLTAVGTVVTEKGKFRYARTAGTLLRPEFALNRLTAKLKDGAEDTLSFRGGFSTAGGAPGSLGEVRVELGSHVRVLAGALFQRKKDTFTYSESADGAKTQVTLDYAKARLIVVLTKIELGTLDGETLDLVVGTGASEQTVRSRIRLAAKKTTRTY